MDTTPVTDPSQALWRANLFGAFRLESAREAITKFESRKSISFLVYLILHEGEPQSREVLADRIWPEADITAGRNRLKQTLASLRRLLEPPGVLSGSVFIADRVNITLRKGAIYPDFKDFVEAEKVNDIGALSRFVGSEFLPGLYDEWLDDLRLWVDSVQSQAQGHQPREVVRLQKEASAQPSTRLIQLPVQVTPYFGREEETAKLTELIQEFRLVTVTGIGGTGKTRLTVNVASQSPFEKICFVGLAEVNDSRSVVPTINSALGLVIPPKVEPLEALREALQGKDCLLVLDNMEQLVGSETAKLLREVLIQCPSVTFLASSRIPLGVESEADYPLFPLPVPRPAQTLETLSESPAARIFIERARRSRSDFQITERNFESVLALLDYLGGMPLAIELCAAWAHVLSPAQMLAQLNQGSNLLVSKRNDIPSRQKSLADAFATTVSLLPPDQRDLLVKLSVFRGGINLDLLCEVVEEQHLSDPLSGLVKAALIQSNPEQERFRYTLLESLRQFTSELPDPENLKGQSQSRLLDLFLNYAAAASMRQPSKELKIETELDWFRFVQQEWDNVRAIINFSLDSNQPEKAIRILEHFESFWRMDAREREVLPWLEAILKSGFEDQEVAHRAKVLRAYANRAIDGIVAARNNLELLLPASRSIGGALLRRHLWRIANLCALGAMYFDIEPYSSEGIALSLGAGDVVMEAHFRKLHSIVHAVKDDYAAAHRELDHAEDLFRQSGFVVDLYYVIHDRAMLFYEQSQFIPASELFGEVIESQEKVGDFRLVARCYNMRGTSLYDAGHPERAFESLVDALIRHAECFDNHGIFYPLWNLGNFLIEQGFFKPGIQFLGAAEGFFLRYIGTDYNDQFKEEANKSQSRAESAMNKEVALAFFRKGKAMSLGELRDLAQNFKATLREV